MAVGRERNGTSDLRSILSKPSKRLRLAYAGRKLCGFYNMSYGFVLNIETWLPPVTACLQKLDRNKL